MSRLLLATSGVPGSLSPSIEHFCFADVALALHRLCRGVGGTAALSPLLIANDTRVYEARVPVKRKSGGRGEVFLLDPQPLGPAERRALLRPQKKLEIGEKLYADRMSEELPLFEVLAKSRDSAEEPQTCLVRCLLPVEEILRDYGVMPLPPYIRRHPEETALCEEDRRRYQTVFARERGSAAAPTASLHFSEELWLALQAEHAMSVATVTLHIGLGTFRPVQTDEPEAHHMHKEIYQIPHESLELIWQALLSGRPIVFLGTTTFRAVESFFRECAEKSAPDPWAGEAFDLNDPACWQAMRANAHAAAGVWRETDLFVYPKSPEQTYRPMLGHGILTNFHQPESTLLMLIAALVGYARQRQIYETAVEHRYRFLSYGDASLLGFARPPFLGWAAHLGKESSREAKR